MRLRCFLLFFVLVSSLNAKTVFDANLSFYDSVEPGVPSSAKLIVQNPTGLDLSDVKEIEDKFLGDLFYFANISPPKSDENNLDVTVFDVTVVITQNATKDLLSFESSKNIFNIKFNKHLVRSFKQAPQNYISYSHLTSDFFSFARDYKVLLITALSGLIIAVVLFKLGLVFYRKRKNKKEQMIAENKHKAFFENVSTREDFEVVYKDRNVFTQLFAEKIDTLNQLLNEIDNVQYYKEWDNAIIENLLKLRDEVLG